MSIDYDSFIGNWIVFQHDKPSPPWASQLPVGSSFEIRKNEKDEYWYLPSTMVQTPLDQKRQLETSKEMELKKGEYELGEKLDGALCIKFPDSPIGLLYFTLNKAGSRRFISLSHMHLVSGSDQAAAHAPDGHEHIATSTGLLNHGGSHGVDH